MTTPTRLAHALGALLLAGAFVILLGAAPAPSAQRVQPNVVVIMTDDQTLESLRVMTSTRRLIARQGVTFDDYVVSFPLCCPSRATFLTGQYSHSHGVIGNNLANGLARLDETNTLPAWLNEAGYATILVGKYLNGHARLQGTSIPYGWGEWYAGAQLGYFRHTMNRNGKIVRYGTSPAAYHSDVLTRTAVDVVERYTQTPTPFFLWLSYFAPHYGGPAELGDPTGLKAPVPAPRHRGVFADEPLPAPPSFDEADMSDKPVALQRRPPLTPEAFDSAEIAYRRSLEALLAVDEGVAAVVDALRRGGALDRTIIIFTSDNGYLRGEHRIALGKEHVYEPSVRVPLLMRGPGIPRGVRLRQPVANIDLAPTIAAAAGATPRRHMDGRSLLPLFADPTLEWGRDILLERGPGGNLVGPLRLYTALRTPRYKYVEHATGERELYDLRADRDELQSLHADPAHAAIRDELARRLAALRDCAGAVCARGPRLGVEAVAAGACAETVRVQGADEPLVDHVEIAAAGTTQRLSDPPFAFSLRGRPGQTLSARVVAELVDGRRVTLGVPVRRCS
jgi:arylsulfatase A-like enzyme